MLGIIVQLAISWLLIWLFEKKDLSVLGLWPSPKRIFYFFIFFLVTAAICSTDFLMQIYFANQKWQLNPNLSATLIFQGFWWNIKSVLFEELIFRGVLLYILIKKIGTTKAILLSSIAFGIYHWFSFGIFGNIIPMIITFFITGTMGLLLAYGYTKTFSLYIPIAIHLGWNLTRIFIFSQGLIGNGVFIPSNTGPFRTDSYLLFFCITFLPMIAALGFNYLLLRKMKTKQDLMFL